MSYVIEKRFEYRGYECAILMQDMGHHCGYVGIPKGHRWYGSDRLHELIGVHGGLTYSNYWREDGYPINEPNTYHWIGWDYAHYRDCADSKCYIENFGREQFDKISKYNSYLFANDGDIYTVYDVERDCKSVVDQLVELQFSKELTKSEAIDELYALKIYFKTKMGTAPKCLDFAINELEKGADE